MTDITPRKHYVSDHSISPLGQFVLWGGLPLFAVAAAWVLKSLFFWGWYLIVLVPALVGLAIGGGMRLLVQASHCRNHWLAGGLGGVTGLAAFLGYFYLCLWELMPAGGIPDPADLPRFIAHRMKTDVAHDVAKPDLRHQPPKPFAGLNWFMFVFELGSMTAIPAAVAWTCARRAYCPALKRWMNREVALFPAYSGEILRAAIEQGRLEAFIAQSPPGGDAQTACRFVLEYAAPQTGSALNYPIYASIEDLPWQRPWYMNARQRRTLLRQIALSLDEVMTVLPLFPQLAKHLGSRHEELRDLPAGMLVELPLSSAGDVARITPVPAPHRQRVRGPGYVFWVNLLGALPLVYIAAGLGAFALAVQVLMNHFEVASLPLFALSFVLLVWGGYTGGWCLGAYENRWINRRLRREISTRPDALVSPQDPRARYVSLIPRENFGKVQLTMSSDLLLLLVDTDCRQLLLEGDSDRYQIPAAAITSVEPQCFSVAGDAQKQLWVVRLLVRVESGLRELYLSVGNTSFRPSTNRRRNTIAQQLCNEIQELRVR